MKANVKKDLKNFMMSSGGGPDTFNQMIMVLDLPDDQFDKIYPQFKPELDKIFLNQDIQREILTATRHNTASPEDIAEARDAIESFLNEIEEDETLSPNKKEMLTTLIKGSLELTFDMVKNPRERITVKIQKIVPEAILPSYAHDSDAGADIYSLEEVTLKPHTTALIKTGIKVAIPGGYEIQIRPRSGLSLKTPLRVANAPGTVDSAYRGEVCVIMENTGNISQTIKAGDKIAQMVIAPVPMIVWEETDTLDDTDRGVGGFGSTDKS